MFSKIRKEIKPITDLLGMWLNVASLATIAGWGLANGFFFFMASTPSVHSFMRLL